MFYAPQDANAKAKKKFVFNPYPLQSRDKKTEGYTSGYFTDENIKLILDHYTPEELEQCIYSHDIRSIGGEYKAYFYGNGKKSDDNMLNVLKSLGYIPKDYKKDKSFIPNFLHVKDVFTPEELEEEVDFGGRTAMCPRTEFPKEIQRFGETYVYTSYHDGYFLKEERFFETKKRKK